MARPARQKPLNARNKGEFDYNYKHDLLLFKIKGRQYAGSLEFDNIIIDIDTENYITGIRIFDASKLFGMPKATLLRIKEFEFKTAVENDIIRIQLRFTAMRRNKPLIQGSQNIERQIEEHLIPETETLATVTT